MANIDFANHGVAKNAEYGAWELNPKPTAEEIGDFYQSKYYELIKSGGRAPAIQNIMKGGDKAEQDRKWLENGTYGDIVNVLEQQKAGKRLLDVGCGTGELITFLAKKGYEVTGIEPSEDATKIANDNGLNVYCSSSDEFIKKCHENGEKFDVITMYHVLEHVPNPKELLVSLKEILNPSGILIVNVPNDFNPLQIAAVEALGVKPWWIARPDHISYFSFKSLGGLFEKIGFDVVDQFASFPLEMFLLMGKNYIENPEVGAQCHKDRCTFEENISTKARRELYRNFAQAGIGRECVVVGRLK